MENMASQGSETVSPVPYGNLVNKANLVHNFS
jgi:hypothetical protein